MYTRIAVANFFLQGKVAWEGGWGRIYRTALLSILSRWVQLITAESVSRAVLQPMGLHAATNLLRGTAIACTLSKDK